MSDDDFREATSQSRAGRRTGLHELGGAASRSYAGDNGGGIARDREGYRDRDPPPTWDGLDPDSTFKTFEKNVRLWEHESDIPRNRRGAKLLRALTGTAQPATEDMDFEETFEEITTEDGVRNIMNKLKEFFLPPGGKPSPGL